MESSELKGRISIKALGLLKNNGTGNKFICPFHEEKTGSFSIKVHDNGFERFRCFGCGESGDIFDFLQKYYNIDFRQSMHELLKITGEINYVDKEENNKDIKLEDIPVKEFGLKCKYNQTQYTYFDENFNILYYVIRTDYSDGKKDFKIFKHVKDIIGSDPIVTSGYKGGRRVPFNCQLIKDREKVLIVEGEKACQYTNTFLAESTKMCCTTWHGGASMANSVEWSKFLKDKIVYLFPDNDDIGIGAMRNIFKEIRYIAKEIRYIEPILEKGSKSDVADLKCLVTDGLNEKDIFSTLIINAKIIS